ncbi:hypothetical protein FJ418_09425 [Mesorhizobium sp. B2-8-3]|nr:hypothetical protein FJ418_09425 [Mesorhizobium sp. B2-8-3]
MSPKSAQRFWDHDMHNQKSCRPKVCSGFGITTCTSRNHVTQKCAAVLGSRHVPKQKFQISSPKREATSCSSASMAGTASGPLAMTRIE